MAWNVVLLFQERSSKVKILVKLRKENRELTKLECVRCYPTVRSYPMLPVPFDDLLLRSPAAPMFIHWEMIFVHEKSEYFLCPILSKSYWVEWRELEYNMHYVIVGDMLCTCNIQKNDWFDIDWTFQLYIFLYLCIIAFDAISSLAPKHINDFMG